MKKRTLLAVTVLTVLVMTSCNNNTDDKSETSKTQTEAQTTESQTTVAQEEESTALTATDGVTLYSGTMTEIPESFMIENTVRIDQQSANDCSGYATALVLRYFGEEVIGSDVYAAFPSIDADGSVWPETIVEYVNSLEGYSATLYTGTLDNLKEELNKGYPVVFLGKVSRENTGYHWMVATGYDADHIYIADSYLSTDESDKYNRIVNNEDFMYMWDTETPGYTQLFIPIVKAE